MELNLNNVEFNEFQLNVNFDSSSLIGITGKALKEVVLFFEEPKNYKGKLFIEKTLLTNYNKFLYHEKVSVIKENPVFPSYLETVIDYLLHEIKIKNIETKDDLKKINSSLKIVGLDSSYKKRSIISLSSCEKKLIQIAANLLINPEVIILDEPFTYFDLNHQKKIFMLLQRMQEQYKKVIIIITDNSNYIYKYTKRAIIIKNKAILLDGLTKEVYKKISYLKKKRIQIPEIVEFTNKAQKEKNVKIEYHKDIRDLIKDIYKHV